MDTNLLKKIPDKIFSIDYFENAVEIVRKNSSGKIWAIGSLVYNTIINEKYGTFLPIKDFDFIVEEIKLPISVSNGTLQINNYGSYKIKIDSRKIDIIPLTNIHSIQRKKLLPSIENYLLGTPFNIQSVAFDLENKEIIGEKSIWAVENKIVTINDSEEAIYSAMINKMSLPQYIGWFSEKLNFKYRLDL